MTEAKQVRVGSAEIANVIRRNIKTGELSAKERLPPERVLAARFHVARGTVREALNQLADETLVEIRAGSGTYVTFDLNESPDGVIVSARPLELLDTRLTFEPNICKLVVLNATHADLREMEELLETMEASAKDPETFSKADTAFHRLLAETTNNKLLIWIASQVVSVRNQDQWSKLRNVILNEESIGRYNEQHRAIFQAITQRDSAMASLKMQAHLEHARLALTNYDAG